MNQSVSRDALKHSELPYCVQGSDAPAFRGGLETGEHLTCAAGCGQVLVEHYVKEDYVNVGIKCFKCGTITRTPGLPLGEVFAAPVLTLGEKGAYLLGSTVNARSGVIITCDQEIAREIEATAPRYRSFPLMISPEGLRALTARYDEIVGMRFSTQRKNVERLGQSSIKTFPFAWAIMHLEKCLASGALDIRRGETLTALLWLNIFSHAVGVWEHHPRFHVVARDLGTPKSFLHTSSKLIAAAYLYRVGNRIGLSLEDQAGQPNPDLYVRVGARDKIHLEVKAPEGLQWGGDQSISVEQIENVVRTCIKKSTSQINRSSRGILIISSSLLSHRFPALLESAIQNALKSKGRNHRSLAAVVGMSPSTFDMTTQSVGTIACNAGFQFSVTLNGYYSGKNPVVTQSRPGCGGAEPVEVTPGPTAT